MVYSSDRTLVLHKPVTGAHTGKKSRAPGEEVV